MKSVSFIKVFEYCYAFFPFFLVIRVNGTLLLDALLCEKLVPIVSLVKSASTGYGFPVENPTRNLRLKHGARVAFARFHTAAGVNYPATVFFFHSGSSPKRKTGDRGI